MECSFKNVDKNQTDQPENARDGDLKEQIPYVISEKEFCKLIKGKLRKWIEEVRKLSKGD
jgi:hypothetical protein